MHVGMTCRGFTGARQWNKLDYCNVPACSKGPKFLIWLGFLGTVETEFRPTREIHSGVRGS